MSVTIQSAVPVILDLPNPPTNPRFVPDYLRRLNQRLGEILRANQRGIEILQEHRIVTGALADRPEATGSKWFYLDEDNEVLYFDKGTWVAV